MFTLFFKVSTHVGNLDTSLRTAEDTRIHALFGYLRRTYGIQCTSAGWLLTDCWPGVWNNRVARLTGTSATCRWTCRNITTFSRTAMYYITARSRGSWSWSILVTFTAIILCQGTAAAKNRSSTGTNTALRVVVVVVSRTVCTVV